MSRYKPVGVSLLPERISMMDARAEELGLSRSKYMQALIDADIDSGLLDCTIDAKGGKPVIKLRDGVSLVVLDKETERDEKVEIIVKAIEVLGSVAPELVRIVMTGNVRKAAERAVKQKQ